VPNDKSDLPVRTFADKAEFAEWLAENVKTSGVWVKFAKKGSGIQSIVYAEALEVALRHGWIDGQVKRVDDEYYQQRFTPRTARSRWSKINRASAERMIAAGEMSEHGLRAVEAAKADGRWEAAYDSPANATVPQDLRAALDASPAASAAFETLTGQNRYAILHRVAEAKRAQTRASRIAKFVDMLERGETPH
jgi:uncharacterized protein YdeI (YjbR/CyaY-like superfamily)